MDDELTVAKGLFYGLLLSIPIWIALWMVMK